MNELLAILLMGFQLYSPIPKYYQGVMDKKPKPYYYFVKQEKDSTETMWVNFRENK